MDDLIGLLVFIFAVGKLIGRVKKVQQNAPGKRVPPVRYVPPEPAEQTKPTEPVVFAPQPTPEAPAEPDVSQEEFWRQMSEVLQQAAEDEGPVAETGGRPAESGHETIVPESEGESRACEHGALGGSIPYDEHEGRTDEAPKRPKKRSEEQPGENTVAAYRPAMNAQEMRRAVVMAEILKRPQERMAEQARRWSLR